LPQTETIQFDSSLEHKLQHRIIIISRVEDV